MCDEVFGVVHVIKCSWSYVVWNDYFLSWFSRNKDGGISFRHQQTVRSNRRVFYEEPDLIIYFVVGTFPDVRWETAAQQESLFL